MLLAWASQQPRATGDVLDAALAALEAAGKLVSAWFLPLSDPDQYLTLAGASVNGWAAAYGSQKVDFAAETSAPQWDATLFSNKGGVTFNGTDQRMLGGGNVSNWPDNTADLYMLVACKAAGTGVRRALSYGDTATTARAIGITAATPLAQLTAGSSSVNGTTAFGANGRTIGAAVDVGGTSAVYLDGVSEATVATAGPALTRTRVRLGASPAVSALNFWSGSIVAAAILNSTASLSDFTSLEALMRARVT